MKGLYFKYLFLYWHN